MLWLMSVCTQFPFSENNLMQRQILTAIFYVYRHFLKDWMTFSEWEIQRKKVKWVRWERRHQSLLSHCRFWNLPFCIFYSHGFDFNLNHFMFCLQKRESQSQSAYLMKYKKKIKRKRIDFIATALCVWLFMQEKILIKDQNFFFFLT